MRSLAVRDEMAWWSDPVPFYLLGAVLGVPMRRVKAEAALRYRLYQDGEVVIDRESVGVREAKLCSEYLLRRSKMRAASRALGQSIATMVCQIERELCGKDAPAE